jgi:hypothetical protein
MQLQVNGSYANSLGIGSSKRAKKCSSRHTVAVAIPPENDQRVFPRSVIIPNVWAVQEVAKVSHGPAVDFINGWKVKLQRQSLSLHRAFHRDI